MKRLATLLLCFLLLGRAAAFDGPSIDETLADYMERHGLNEDNFAMGWMDLASGEVWYFQPDQYMVAGSMYKLPLNMAVTDRLADGTFAPDDIVGGYQISVAQTLSIIYSDNDAADALEHALSPDHTEYRDMLAAYSGIPVAKLPEAYYHDNKISPRFMIGTLQYLYEHASAYETLIADLKKAHPGRYFQSTQGEYEIAHKYGYFEGALADCAIVYTPQPFALVVFLSGSAAREEHLGELCGLMTEYSLLPGRPTPSPEPTQEAVSTGAAAAVTPPTPEPVVTPAPEVPQTRAGFPLSECILAAALVAVAVTALRKRK
jgi:hypothetical protein